MRLEMSYLISLAYTPDTVTYQEIGDGVRIEDLQLNNKKVELYELLRARNQPQYERLIFREQLELSHYTHRFFVALEGITSLSDPLIQHAEQLLMRAIILARMVRPISIPLHPTSIRCYYGDNDTVMCFAGTHVGFYSAAYVRARSELPRLTHADAAQIQAYWKASQFIYDNRFQHLRIYRALYMFNDACHIRPLNIRHIALHAVLESLICTSPSRNRLQVIQRLPCLTDLSSIQAEAIYDLCADFKHSAAPNFLNSPDVENLTADDAQREQATVWPEDALRALFQKILNNKSFLDDLADPVKLRLKYPVRDKNGNLAKDRSGNLV